MRFIYRDEQFQRYVLEQRELSMKTKTRKS